MLEKDIETEVCRYARDKFNALTYKFTSPSRRSVPDRLFIFPNGRDVFIEFKATGKTPTSGQLREIQRLRQHGKTVWVVDNIDIGKTLLHCFTAEGHPEREDWGQDDPETP